MHWTALEIPAKSINAMDAAIRAERSRFQRNRAEKTSAFPIRACKYQPHHLFARQHIIRAQRTHAHAEKSRCQFAVTEQVFIEKCN
jgi:hypothetical protein